MIRTFNTELMLGNASLVPLAKLLLVIINHHRTLIGQPTLWPGGKAPQEKKAEENPEQEQ